MGNETASKFLIVILVCFLLKPITVEAATPAELYTEYDLQYADSYPDGVLETISAYQNAQKYETMYYYVVSSDYDTSIIDRRITELEATLKDCENKLQSGYSLSISEIYELEDLYNTTLDKLEDAKSAANVVEIDYHMPTLSDVPSYDEYCEALSIKSKYDSTQELGTLMINVPVTGDSSVNEDTDKHLLLDAQAGSTVTSLFNGTVVQVTENSVTVQHPGNIYTYYGNLESVYVVENESVYQGEGVGSASETVMLKMKINGNFVPISKLISKES